MIAAPEKTIHLRASTCQQRIQKKMGHLCVSELVSVYSRVGGGAMPEQNISSWAVAVRPGGMTIHQLEKSLRRAPVPVIGRVEDDRLLLDMRTVDDDELDVLVESLWNCLALQAGDGKGTSFGEK
jgi:L-seryl-tRNA(Ser) seleniumtransferase